MDLERSMAEHGFKLEGRDLEKLRDYLDFLLSSPLNLTSIEPDRMVEKVVLDTLYPLREFHIDDDFIDIGTGGGIPGVVISIVFKVGGVLVDSRKKKVEALRKFVVSSGLELEVVWARAEELAHDPDYRERFLFVTSRALSKMKIALELTAPFAVPGGYILMYKGPSWREELEESWKAMEILGVDLGDVIEYTLPGGERRALVLLEKISRTPKRYPRRPGIPKKRPLG